MICTSTGVIDYINLNVCYYYYWRENIETEMNFYGLYKQIYKC